MEQEKLLLRERILDAIKNRNAGEIKEIFETILISILRVVRWC